MKPHYKISIPKPCHENWSEMTPNEKGRFCQSCSKTVVDFTKMSTHDIQSFIHHNKHQRICGHIRQTQLDSINLQISEVVFEQTMSFHKLFLLALLLAMGTSLLSCSDEKGQTKKIESVEIIEKAIDSIEKPTIESKDTIPITKVKKDKPPYCPPPSPLSTGIMVTGEVIEQKPPIPADSIIDPQPPEIEGEIDVVVGIIEPPFSSDSENPYSFHEIDTPPKFPDTHTDISNEELKQAFQDNIARFVNDNFQLNPLLCLDLSGKQRIYVQFTINEHGNTTDIKVRAPHLSLEKEAIRVIKLLPKFTPATYQDNTVKITYNLPIAFEVKD